MAKLNKNTLKITAIIIALLIVITFAYVLSTYIFLKIYKINYAPNPIILFQYYMAYVDMPNTPKRFSTALKGFVYIPIIAVIAAALFILLSKNKKQSLHGDARFANFKEVKEDGLIKDYSKQEKEDALALQHRINEQNKKENRNFDLGKNYKGFVLPPKSLLLGKFNNKFLTFEGFQFAFLSAPTRSGKGVGIVIPNLLSYPESMVVLDIKYENYEITSGFRQLCLNQTIYRFSPFDENGASHRYNPLTYVAEGAKRITDIDAIGGALYRPAPGEKDPFWKDNAKNLFRGLALMVIENPEFDRTIGQIARIGTGMGHPEGFKGFIKERLQKGFLKNGERHQYSNICSQTLEAVINMPDQTFGGVVSSFSTPLNSWANPYVDNATSADDFDLRDVRKKGMTIYVGVQPKYLSQASNILNIFFDQLIAENTTKLPKEDPSLTHQCVLLMDEFTALGRVQSMSDAIGFMAGYNMRPFIIIQNREQLEDVYGKEQAKTMLSNFATMVMYPPSALNTEEAQKCSEMLGYTTFKSESKGRSNPSGFGNGSSSQSTNISDQRRALMLPQEILAMKSTEEIVKVNNSKPIFAEKIRYYQDKDFTCRANMQRTVIPAVDVTAFSAAIDAKTDAIKNYLADVQKDAVENVLDAIPNERDELTSAENEKFNPSDLDFCSQYLNEQPENKVDLTNPADKAAATDLADEISTVQSSSKATDNSTQNNTYTTENAAQDLKTYKEY